MRRTNLYPITQAVLAAALFGASAPLSKLLLGEVQPIPLAALLYLGSGCGMLMYRFIRRSSVRGTGNEAGMSRSDAPWLASADRTPVQPAGDARGHGLYFGLQGHSLSA